MRGGTEWVVLFYKIRFFYIFTQILEYRRNLNFNLRDLLFQLQLQHQLGQTQSIETMAVSNAIQTPSPAVSCVEAGLDPAVNNIRYQQLLRQQQHHKQQQTAIELQLQEMRHLSISPAMLGQVPIRLSKAPDDIYLPAVAPANHTPSPLYLSLQSPGLSSIDPAFTTSLMGPVPSQYDVAKVGGSFSMMGPSGGSGNIRANHVQCSSFQ